MNNIPIRVVQISDTHLFSDKEKSLLGVKTQESFRAVINLLKREIKKNDLIVLSGDLSQDSSTAAYISLADDLNTLHVPVYWVAGNHDDLVTIKQIYPREFVSNDKHVVLKNWQIILLNSQKPGAVEGYFDTSQLDYLQQCLESCPKHYAIIFFHHQPVSVGCGWLESIGLCNAKEFWDLTARYPMIKGVFFGHVHQEFQQTVQGIPCYSAPSTCIQFKPKQVSFALEKNPPGYRWIELYEEGYFETTVQRLAKYVGVFDVHAKGY